MKLLRYVKTDFSADLSASLVVFLIAIPLCLGIALASGAPLMSGLISGIVGGIVVGSLGGSSLGVSGPAAGLVAVMLAALAALGTFEVVLMAVVLAGIIQFILGLIRAGVLAYYVPNTVIKGLLSAIGLIIILKEIPYAAGWDMGAGGPTMAELLRDFSPEAFAQLYAGISSGAIFIAVVGLAILITWKIPALEKYPFFQKFPAALMVIIVGVLLQVFFSAFIPALALDAALLVSLPGAGSWSEMFVFPDFSSIFSSKVWLYGIMIAAVASVETLVVAEATDKMDPDKRLTPMDKELRAQGIGNLVCGLLGGLPITQVIVRSSANIQSGGKTRGSAIMHGVLLIGAILIFPAIMNLIPLASLAAILIMVGYNLVKPELIKEMYQKGWKQFLPFLVTMVAILFTDLLIGLGIGMAVSIFLILRNNHRLPYAFRYEQNDQRIHLRIQLSENVTFLNKSDILSTLRKIPDGAVLEIDATKSKAIHPDVLEAIDDFKENAKHRDILVKITGLKPERDEPSPAKMLQDKLEDALLVAEPPN